MEHLLLEKKDIEKKQIEAVSQDFLPLMGTDFIELYVGNAKQSAHFYKTAFGFQSLAYSGLETGNKECASYVLRQGKITLVLTTPYNSNSLIADHVKKHGDGVKAIAFMVDDASSTINAIALTPSPCFFT